jgi:hypothetical protein
MPEDLLEQFISEMLRMGPRLEQGYTEAQFRADARRILGSGVTRGDE